MILDYLASDDVPERDRGDALARAGLHLRALRADPPEGRVRLAGAAARRRARPGAHPLDLGARLDRLPGQDRPDGSCPISFMVPSHPNGTAAAVIRVTSPDASAEIQFPIKKTMSAELSVTVNGERMTVPAGASVADLLERLGVANPRVAVERNRDIVPKAEYARDRARRRATSSRSWSSSAADSLDRFRSGLAAPCARSAILRAPSGPLAQLVEQETLNL